MKSVELFIVKRRCEYIVVTSYGLRVKTNLLDAGPASMLVYPGDSEKTMFDCLALRHVL